MMGKLLSFWLLIIIGFSTAAQQIEPKHTFNIELGLPNGMVNKPFKDYMQGLVNIAPYYQYTLKNSLSFGAGIRYGYFGVNQFRVPLKTLGGMHSGGVFVKVGREKFHTDRFATDMGVKIGYNQNYFVTNRNDSLGQNPFVVSVISIEPTIKFALVADEQVSYNIFVSYVFQGYAFKPNMLGLETNGGYDEKEFSRPTSMLIIGFGFSYYFKDKS